MLVDIQEDTKMGVNFSNEQLDAWIDYFKGYRLPEREKTKTPYDKALVGKRVSFKKIVIRTGYRLTPQDPFPTDSLGEETDAMCVKYLAQKSGKAEDVIKEVVDALDLRNPYKHVRYNVLGMAMNAMKNRYYERKLPENLNLRTFWYVDYDSKIDDFATVERSMHGTARDVVHRQVGIRNPGSHYGGWDYEDYDPPFLDLKLTQPLYRVDLDWLPSSWRIKTRTGWLGYTVFVHPADIIG